MEIPAGGIVFKEGEMNNAMYVILSGSVEVFLHEKYRSASCRDGERRFFWRNGVVSCKAEDCDCKSDFGLSARSH